MGDMRARNIKPGLFCNEVLARCDFGARLLFTGLWCMADRDGRLEDRPERIKAQLFPYDRAPVDKWLEQLAENDFICRYESQGKKYIEVTNFVKHQNPHKREAPSTIPAPDKPSKGTAQHSARPGAAPDKAGTSPEKAQTSPADSLIPDSGFSDSLIPDSLIGDGMCSAGASTATPKATRFVKPTLAETLAYFTELGSPDEAEHFYDHYEANGWVQGRNKPIKSWRAAARNWLRNDFGRKQSPSPVAAGSRYVDPNSPEALEWSPM
jgi:hypothetical protein